MKETPTKKYCQVALLEEAKDKLMIYAAYKKIPIKDALVVAVNLLCGKISVSNPQKKEAK